MTASALSRRIGTDGPSVSPLGLGCMGLSETYGSTTDAASVEVIRRALDLGVTHFDTADMYGCGHNEELVGRALGGRRDQVLIASKFGYRFTGDDRRIDSSAGWAVEACEASLRRLTADHIDLYYLHRRNPKVPIEDTIGAMAALIEQGKVRWLGLSEVSPETLRRAHAVHPIAAVQMEYSMFTRDVETDMLPVCRELGVALVAYAPVGRGWLTGAVTSRTDLAETDTRRDHPRFGEMAFESNRRLVTTLAKVAAEIGTTPAQAALAWLLAQGHDILPIPGTRRIEHLEQNLAATSLALTSEQLQRLSNAIPVGDVVGDRHTRANLTTMGH